MAKHQDLGAEKAHVPGFFQETDPGAVGAGKLWIDTSGGTGNWVIKLRNEADDGWEAVSGNSGYTDHGALLGLEDDDHLQYLTEARGDALYEPLGGGGAEWPELFNPVDRLWNPVVFSGLAFNIAPALQNEPGLVIATGDGAQSAFDDQGSGHLFAADPGSITITVLLTDAETATITDDGEGALADVANGVTGTVNYGTGEWTLSFSGAVPANLEDLVSVHDYYGGAGTIRVTAYDLLRNVHGGFPPFQYGLAQFSGGVPPTFYADPKDAYLEFTCLEVGQQPVEVWVEDVYGNTRFVEGNVSIQDNFTECP